LSGKGERGLDLPRDSAFTIAVFMVALLPRLFVAIAWAKEPVWDGHYYHFGAERIARGLGYSEDVLAHGQLLWKPWVHYPVGYSALLGLVYRVFGSELVVAPVVNALTGALLVAVVHRFARYYLSRERARAAAALSALHPGLIAYSAVVMTEPLAARRSARARHAGAPVELAGRTALVLDPAASASTSRVACRAQQPGGALGRPTVDD
jgi:hypothetical protein